LKLVDDIHHLMFIAIDMDRLIAFYQRVFGARATVDLTEEGLRHAFIEVRPHTVLHPFQLPGVEPPASLPMSQRGRLDYVALNAAKDDASRELRRGVIAEKTGDGAVTDRARAQPGHARHGRDVDYRALTLTLHLRRICADHLVGANHVDGIYALEVLRGTRQPLRASCTAQAALPASLGPRMCCPSWHSS
jgi:catechol 2,3-dioxygenase-like lactoylglutathione lyase family enzyme